MGSNAGHQQIAPALTGITELVVQAQAGGLYSESDSISRAKTLPDCLDTAATDPPGLGGATHGELLARHRIDEAAGDLRATIDER